MNIVNPYGISTVLMYLECGWDHFFLAEAFFVSGKSKDPSTQCGCVITTSGHDKLTVGWNDLARGIAHLPERHERPAKYLWTEHAERNAVYNAGRMGVSLQGARLFVTRMPCPDCARAIIQSGVKSVTSCIYDDEFEWDRRANTSVGAEMLNEAGVSIRIYSPEIAAKLQRFRYEPC